MWNGFPPKAKGMHLSFEILAITNAPSDALPSHGGETQVRVSQSQVAELGLGSTLPASNSRKG